MVARDDFAAARRIDDEVLEHNRLRGDRVGEKMAIGHLLYDLFMLGEWDEAERLLAELEPLGVARSAIDRLNHGTLLLVNRGDVPAARRILDEFASFRISDAGQSRVPYLLAAGAVLGGGGKP